MKIPDYYSLKMPVYFRNREVFTLKKRWRWGQFNLDVRSYAERELMCFLYEQHKATLASVGKKLNFSQSYIGHCLKKQKRLKNVDSRKLLPMHSDLKHLIEN